MVIYLLYTSLFIAGWIAHKIFQFLVHKVRVELNRRHSVTVKPGESGRERYQKYKEARALKPIPPPPGTSPELALRFSRLTPEVQRKVIAARKVQGING